jgi:hypothetical protein
MKKLLLPAAALLMAASLPAMAVTAKSAPYIGGEIGFGSPELSTDESISSGGVNILPTSSTVGGAAFGGIVGYNYALTQNWLIGAEFGYHRDAKASYDYGSLGGFDITSDDYDLLFTGTYLLDSGWNFFGKVGVARLIQDAKATDGATGSTDVKAYKPALKLGVGYLFDFQTAGSMNLFAQYGHIFGKNGTNNGIDLNTDAIAVNFITVGVAYNLPV